VFCPSKRRLHEHHRLGLAHFRDRARVVVSVPALRALVIRVRAAWQVAAPDLGHLLVVHHRDLIAIHAALQVQRADQVRQ
jgi:hypothetical protein